MSDDETITNPLFYQVVRDDLEDQIEQLEQRLSRLRIRLSELERTERRVIRARAAREARNRVAQETNTHRGFLIGDRVVVINRYDELHQEEGNVTRISRNFVYFTLDNGTTRYRAPHNIRVVRRVQERHHQ